MSIPSVSNHSWTSFFSSLITTPFSFLLEKIKSVFNQIAFSKNKSHFTEEMKRRIVQIKTDPHDLSKDNGEIKQLREAVLDFLHQLLKNPQQNEEMARLYASLNNMAKKISSVQSEYDKLRREHLPQIFAELLLNENEPSHMFAYLCPFLKNGKLELEQNKTVSLSEFREKFPDIQQAKEALTEKFKALMTKKSAEIGHFLESIEKPKNLALSTDQQEAALVKTLSTIFEKVMDRAAVKVQEIENFSHYFDTGADWLKEQLQSIEASRQKAEENREAIDGLKALLQQDVQPQLNDKTKSFIEAVWGQQENLYEFLKTEEAKYLEEVYLNEVFCKSITFDGQTVPRAALEAQDPAHWVRERIRHLKKMQHEKPFFDATQKEAVEELKALVLQNGQLSQETEQIAIEVWGKDFETRMPKDKEAAFLERTDILFIKLPPPSCPPSPSKKRPASPTGIKFGNWLWKIQRFEHLTHEKQQEFERLCLSTWGLSSEELIHFSDAKREAIFREAAYKRHVKEKMAAKISNFIGAKIEKWYDLKFLDELVKELKNNSDLAPLLALLGDGLIDLIKNSTQVAITNGIKWGLKNHVIDLLFESIEQKRIVDGVLPEAIKALHSNIIKTLFEQRLADITMALLIPGEEVSLIGEIADQYSLILQIEGIDPPLNFEAKKILEEIFKSIKQDLSTLTTEIDENENWSIEEKKKTLSDALNYYLKALPGENQPVYSDLATHIIFQMGTLPQKIQAAKNSYFYKSLLKIANVSSFLSQAITSNLVPFRTGYRETLRIATQTIKNIEIATPSHVPFEIRLSFKECPTKRHEPTAERIALLKALNQNNIGKNGVILPILPDVNELVIRFNAKKEWLKENDTKTVSNILDQLGLQKFKDQFVHERLQTTLREKLLADKTDKLAQSIFTLIKVHLRIAAPVSWLSKWKSSFFQSIISTYLPKEGVTTFIHSLMKRVLFQGLFYPQDPIPPSSVTTLSDRSKRIIADGGISIPHFLKDAFDPKSESKASCFDDRHPTLTDPEIKRLASLLSDGLGVILPVILNGSNLPLQSVLSVSKQASQIEIKAIVKALLSRVSFVLPKQGVFESEEDFENRYQPLYDKSLIVLKTLWNLIKDKDAFIDLIKTKGFSGSIFESIEDDECLEFSSLTSAQQKELYHLLLQTTMEELCQTTTVQKAREAISTTLAANLAQKSDSSSKIAPMQGSDRTEKLLCLLLDQLEGKNDFLRARASMREFAGKFESHVKSFQVTPLLKFDPISVYLTDHQNHLHHLLYPLLLSLAPEEHQTAPLNELIEMGYLSELVSSERYMGLIMRDVERGVSPFYEFLERLKSLNPFKQVQKTGSLDALKAFFEENIAHSPFNTHLLPVLRQLQSASEELEDASLSVKDLYAKYADRLFAPLPLFKNSFNRLKQDPLFSAQLLPILQSFHTQTVDDFERLYHYHLKDLTEENFNSRIKKDFRFAEHVKQLILYLLDPNERNTQRTRSSLELFKEHKEKLFEPNLYVSLLLNRTDYKAPPLYEKIADVFFAPLISSLFTKLIDLQQRSFFKRIIQTLVTKIHHHLEAIFAVEDNPEYFNSHPALGNPSKTGTLILSLIKRLKETFLTDQEQKKVMTLFWNRREELFALSNFKDLKELFEGLFPDESSFVSFGLTLINRVDSLLEPKAKDQLEMEKVTRFVTDILHQMSNPTHIQGILLNVLPAISNSLKPLILSICILQIAKTDNDLLQELWSYTQEIAEPQAIYHHLKKIADQLAPNIFYPEHILMVQQSLFEKCSSSNASNLEAFKAFLHEEEPEIQPKEQTEKDSYFLIAQLIASKFTTTCWPSVGFVLSNTISLFSNWNKNMINQELVKALTPIVEHEKPVSWLSQMLQPIMKEVLNRQFFMEKPIKNNPSEEAFQKQAQELGKLIELLLPNSIKNYFLDGKMIGDAVGKILFNSTNQSWKIENLFLYILSAFKEELAPIET